MDHTLVIRTRTLSVLFTAGLTLIALGLMYLGATLQSARAESLPWQEACAAPLFLDAPQSDCWATPNDGVVSVTARCEEPARRTKLFVQVSDTGPGIPPEIRSRLFQKFVSGRQEERGSGLGLAFCKLAVEAHGERIWVESTPGQGTTFTFSLAITPSTA